MLRSQRLRRLHLLGAFTLLVISAHTAMASAESLDLAYVDVECRKDSASLVNSDTMIAHVTYDPDTVRQIFGDHWNVRVDFQLDLRTGLLLETVSGRLDPQSNHVEFAGPRIPADVPSVQGSIKVTLLLPDGNDRLVQMEVYLLRKNAVLVTVGSHELREARVRHHDADRVPPVDRGTEPLQPSAPTDPRCGAGIRCLFGHED